MATVLARIGGFYPFFADSGGTVPARLSQLFIKE
jgi:hypothetical protein